MSYDPAKHNIWQLQKLSQYQNTNNFIYFFNPLNKNIYSKCIESL